MTLVCHRCGADLPGEHPRGFCAACGAPQMTLGEDFAREQAAGETTGTPPPPRPRAIAWPAAMRSAAVVAGGITLLFAAACVVPWLGFFSLLSISAAAFLAVGLYRRQQPVAVIDAAIGARIGLSTGLLLAALLTMVVTASLLVARFRTHAMDAFDAQWNTQMRLLLDRSRTGAPLPPEVVAQMNAPEYRAGSMLGGIVLLGVVLIATTTGSGAFAGSIAVRKQQAV